MGELARESWPRRRRLAALALLALLLLLGSWRIGRPPVEAGRAEAPPALVPGIAAPTLVPDSVRHTSLHIALGSLRRTPYSHSVPDSPFAALWPVDEPGWDYAAFTGSRTAAALIDVPRLVDDIGRSPEIPAIAWEEGALGGEPATPEEALITLYATWTEEAVHNRRAWDAFLARKVPDGRALHDMTPAERNTLMADPDVPRQVYAETGAHAEAVLATWPDHPVADHALFGLVRAELAAIRTELDPDALGGWFDEIDHPKVREQAALLISGQIGRTALPMALVDRVAAVPASSGTNAMRLGTWAVDRAMAAGDWERAERWSAIVREQLAEPCGAAETDYRYRCDFRLGAQDEVGARLAALGVHPPRTWEEALRAAAWRCHLDEGPHAGSSTTLATWDGVRWAFGGWDGPTAVTACFDRQPHDGPAPPEPLAVKITLEGGGGPSAPR